MKQLWMNFLTRRLLSGLQAAADHAPAWQPAATQENAARLAEQLMTA